MTVYPASRTDVHGPSRRWECVLLLPRFLGYWLDWVYFGNGRGTSMPYNDGKLYWLSGDFYTVSGGLGAQLHSHQWRVPYPGETRELAGERFRVFDASRRGFRVSVSWALARHKIEIEDVRAFRAKLEDWRGY